MKCSITALCTVNKASEHRGVKITPISSPQTCIFGFHQSPSILLLSVFFLQKIPVIIYLFFLFVFNFCLFFAFCYTGSNDSASAPPNLGSMRPHHSPFQANFALPLPSVTESDSGHSLRGLLNSREYQFLIPLITITSTLSISSWTPQKIVICVFCFLIFLY